MYRACVHDEVMPGPGMPHEKHDREEFALEAVTGGTGGDQVPQRVRSAVSERVHVIERGVREFERFGAVDTAATAVAHGRALKGVLVVGGRKAAGTTGMGRRAGTKDSVIVPSGQFHLA
jgi:hypothetical protein